ncbi:tetratricopeptide repeat protein [Spirochaetota bacterium]
MTRAAAPFVALVMALAMMATAVAPTQAQAKKPVDAKALYDAGAALLVAGETYRAVDALMEAVAVNPAYADAWALLARCQYDLGEYERSVSFIHEVYRFGPRSPRLVCLEGFGLIGLGKIGEARVLFEEALKRLPNDRDARYGLALLDVRNGRPSDAKARLSASLKSAPNDPRAILSLALIARTEGRAEEAATYLSEALRWTAGDAEASYAAASMYAEQGDATEAARLARIAIDAKPSHAGARGLLASLYYERGALDEARAILDGSLAYNRSDPQAWFLLGLVEESAGRFTEAEYALSTLTALQPDDELARIALENLIMDSTGFEAPARSNLAAWRFSRAADFESRLLYEKAAAEYRRGLVIDPYANKGRRRYAELLRGSGLPAMYLSELRFLSSLGKSDSALSDAIEIYDSLLERSVARDWSINGSVSSGATRIAVFSIGPGGTPYHAGSDMVVSRYLRDSMVFEPGMNPERGSPRVPSFADAYRLARESGVDYFVLVGVAENQRDVIVSAELRVAKTGALVTRLEAPRSGNDRIALSVSRLMSGLQSSMALRGVILERRGDLALVNLGRIDGITPDDSFLVIKNGAVSIKPDGSGLSWSDADVVARIAVGRLDDELFEGKLERVGFFDRVNPRDSVVREPTKPDAADVVGTKPTKKTALESAAPALLPSSYVWSALFERVRRLY